MAKLILLFLSLSIYGVCGRTRRDVETEDYGIDDEDYFDDDYDDDYDEYYDYDDEDNISTMDEGNVTVNAAENDDGSGAIKCTLDKHNVEILWDYKVDPKNYPTVYPEKRRRTARAAIIRVRTLTNTNT